MCWEGKKKVYPKAVIGGDSEGGQSKVNKA
jgi:hypothetical protein